ncbi:MAG: hypothetical protein GC157_14680 [Frankiales bacterium]|nr:hypothetical protein [Frankiales bacterium]
MEQANPFRRPLAELEDEARVAAEDLVETQSVSDIPRYVDPAELDRARLLSPTGDGRWTPGAGA